MDLLLPLFEFPGSDDLLFKGRATDLKKINAETFGLEDHHAGFNRDIHEPVSLEEPGQFPADPAILGIVIAVKMENISHEISVPKINRHSFKIRLDK